MSAAIDTDTIPVDVITVGGRLREDMGNIDELAESITLCGLIQPIVVDGENHLIAGGRRLAAVQQLDWERIPVRRYGDLTARERLDIEVEENRRRKRLTSYERAKATTRLAALARQVAEEEPQSSCVDSTQSEAPHHKPGSLRDLEARLGIDEATIRTAERHVHAVEFYPALAALPQYKVFDLANLLDTLPAEERPQFQERIAADPEHTYRIERAITQRAHDLRPSKARVRKQQSPTPAPPSAPATPSFTPDQQDRLALQKFRETYLRQQDTAFEMLALHPRAIRKALAPTDLTEVQTFLSKLRPCLEAFQAEMGSPSGARNGGAAW